jgi:hypothetical protein
MNNSGMSIYFMHVYFFGQQGISKKIKCPAHCVVVFIVQMWINSRLILTILFIQFATKLEMSFMAHEVGVSHLLLQ